MSRSQEEMLEVLAPAVDGIVTAFVVLVEYVDPDGDTCTAAWTMDQQSAIRTLGLVSYMKAIEERRLIRSFDYGDD